MVNSYLRSNVYDLKFSEVYPVPNARITRSPVPTERHYCEPDSDSSDDILKDRFVDDDNNDDEVLDQDVANQSDSDYRPTLDSDSDIPPDPVGDAVVYHGCPHRERRFPNMYGDFDFSRD